MLAAPALAAGDRPRPNVGEEYVFHNVVDKATASAPAAALDQAVRARAFTVHEILDPGSRAWAAAQGLVITTERPATLLASGVLAHAGDGSAAAAVLSNGNIRLFGPEACTLLALPQNRPAYALALSAAGNALAAWDPAAAELVFFDLTAPGCPATQTPAPMRGQAALTLSPSGAYLAAQDATGALWAGPRGGQMQLLSTLSGPPAAIGFSEGEGVLLVLDAQGQGGAWNPRSGKPLRAMKVPGGPFARGSFAHGEARLFTTEDRFVRWDMLHNQAVDNESPPPVVTEDSNGPQEAPKAPGWLELRGTDLYYVGAQLAWRPEPVYEPRLPALSWSRQTACLRLSDVDGQVRYYDAKNGQEIGQRLADDWTGVPIGANGSASIPGLKLQVYDLLPRAGTAPAGQGKDSQLYCRAISTTKVFLWTDSPPSLDIKVQAPPADPKTPLQKVADDPQALKTILTLPLRLGIAETSPQQALRLDLKN